MGRRARARRGIRGGDAIPTPRTRRVRVTTAALAVALLGAVAAYAGSAGDRLVALVVGLGVAGCVVVGVATVFRMALLIPWGVAFVGAAYALYLRLREGDVDTRAVFVAAALVVACELAFLSIRRAVGAPDRRLLIDEGVTFVVIVFTTLLFGDVLLVASGAGNAGLVLEAFGAFAAVAAVAVVVRAATRSRDSTST